MVHIDDASDALVRALADQTDELRAEIYEDGRAALVIADEIASALMNDRIGPDVIRLAETYRDLRRKMRDTGVVLKAVQN